MVAVVCSNAPTLLALRLKLENVKAWSAPAHTFPVAAAAGQQFDFTVTVPGQVEIELHHLGRTVTTLLVRR